MQDDGLRQFQGFGVGHGKAERDLDNFNASGYTKNRKGAAGRRLAPLYDYRSNRRAGELRAVTSFCYVPGEPGQQYR